MVTSRKSTPTTAAGQNCPCPSILICERFVGNGFVRQDLGLHSINMHLSFIGSPKCRLLACILVSVIYPCALREGQLVQIRNLADWHTAWRLSRTMQCRKMVDKLCLTIGANKRVLRRIVLVRCIQCYIVDVTLDPPKISCWMHPNNALFCGACW